MNQKLYRTASLLALAIGAMSIVAGGQVLLGRDPDYYVIDWLPAYNFAIGALSVFVTAILIWKRSANAMAAAAATFGAHVVVLLILQIGYRSVVAIDSILAMTLRITVWLIILSILRYAGRRSAGEGHQNNSIHPIK